MKWNKPNQDANIAPKLSDIMPAQSEIPDEFKDQHNKWCKWQSHWFFTGLEKEEIPEVKTGINKKIAIRHLSCIQSSWEPKHEHKQYAVAWLASLWFKKAPELNHGKKLSS